MTGTVSGAEKTFTTDADLDPPDPLNALPEAGQVELTWVHGEGATETLIRYKAGSYPVDETDGFELYEGTANNAMHEDATPGTTYYYRGWGKSGVDYSATYTDVMATVPMAGSEDGEGFGDIPIMGEWFQAPDHTRMSAFPLYGMVNNLADTVTMPYGTAWMLFALFFVTSTGIAVYSFSHNPSIAGVSVLLVIGMSSWFGLLPIVIMLVYGIIALGVTVAGRFI